MRKCSDGNGSKLRYLAAGLSALRNSEQCAEFWHQIMLNAAIQHDLRPKFTHCKRPSAKTESFPVTVCQVRLSQVGLGQVRLVYNTILKLDHFQLAQFPVRTFSLEHFPVYLQQNQSSFHYSILLLEHFPFRTFSIRAFTNQSIFHQSIFHQHIFQFHHFPNQSKNGLRSVPLDLIQWIPAAGKLPRYWCFSWRNASA